MHVTRRNQAQRKIGDAVFFLPFLLMCFSDGTKADEDRPYKDDRKWNTLACKLRMYIQFR